MVVGCRLPLWEVEVGRNNLLGTVAPKGSRPLEVEGASLTCSGEGPGKDTESFPRYG